MSRVAVVTLLVAAVAACVTPKSAGPADDAADVVSVDLTIRRLVRGVWLHETMDDKAHINASGLLVETPAGVVMIDTGWTPELTERVLAFAESRLKKPVVQVLLTHAHEDRAGGLSAVLARKIPVAAFEATATALGQGIKGLKADSTVSVGNERFEVFFPGAAHSADNAVVWLPRDHVLFGGCAIKSAAAKDLGNTADANLQSWAAVIRKLKERYSTAAFVVPGHGAPGTVELFAHTASLLPAVDAGTRQ